MFIVQLNKYIIWSCWNWAWFWLSRLGLFFWPECKTLQMRFPAALACQRFCSTPLWLVTQLLDCGPHPVSPEAPLSFFIQKQHHASTAAHGSSDSIYCFSTLPCLLLFIWLLYFRGLQSLFWPWWNLLFYFWLHGFHVNISMKQRMWGGLGSGVPVCCRGVFAQSSGLPHSQCRARPQAGSSMEGQRPTWVGEKVPRIHTLLSGENIQDLFKGHLTFSYGIIYASWSGSGMGLLLLLLF